MEDILQQVTIRNFPKEQGFECDGARTVHEKSLRLLVCSRYFPSFTLASSQQTRDCMLFKSEHLKEIRT